MDFYTLKLCGLTRKLPIVFLTPRLKIASFNLLGDGELVDRIAIELGSKIKKLDFDYLVGPEVKVVPLLQAISSQLKKPRYVILRKSIMGYMVKPVSNKPNPILVLDGRDAALLKNKKVILVDDVVTTGKTIQVVDELMRAVNAKVLAVFAVFKQGETQEKIEYPFFYLDKLPLFTP